MHLLNLVEYATFKIYLSHSAIGKKEKSDVEVAPRLFRYRIRWARYGDVRRMASIIDDKKERFELMPKPLYLINLEIENR